MTTTNPTASRTGSADDEHDLAMAAKGIAGEVADRAAAAASRLPEAANVTGAQLERAGQAIRSEPEEEAPGVRGSGVKAPRHKRAHSGGNRCVVPQTRNDGRSLESAAPH